MTTIVEFIEEVNGQEVVRERELSTQRFSVKLDTTGDGTPDTLFTPVLTTEIEMENGSDQANPQDQCGNTEKLRATNLGWSINVTGIVTDSERQGNLSLSVLRDEVAVADKVTIRCDLISGPVAVNNTVLTQASDLVSINTQETEDEEKAFEFQLQLGSDSGGE